MSCGGAKGYHAEYCCADDRKLHVVDRTDDCRVWSVRKMVSDPFAHWLCFVNLTVPQVSVSCAVSIYPWGYASPSSKVESLRVVVVVRMWSDGRLEQQNDWRAL
jgi:hypothetical protein